MTKSEMKEGHYNQSYRNSLLRAYCDQLCAKNFNNLNEMDKF